MTVRSLEGTCIQATFDASRGSCAQGTKESRRKPTETDVPKPTAINRERQGIDAKPRICLRSPKQLRVTAGTECAI